MSAFIVVILEININEIIKSHIYYNLSNISIVIILLFTAFASKLTVAK